MENKESNSSSNSGLDSANYGKTSGLRKIADVKEPCLSNEHYPPNNIHLDPGTYEYICPSCGERMEFTVPLVTC
jgi:hypothetical protein